MTARVWRMHAEHAGTEYRHIGDPRYVRHYGHEPVPVAVTEHPGGAWYGVPLDHDTAPKATQGDRQP